MSYLVGKRLVIDEDDKVALSIKFLHLLANLKLSSYVKECTYADNYWASIALVQRHDPSETGKSKRLFHANI